MVDLSTAKRVVVTGGCGFIGAHVVNLLLDTFPNLIVTDIDKLTYASDPNRVKKEHREGGRYNLMRFDINSPDARHLITGLEWQAVIPKADAVIHLAAETHVDNSIMEAESFLDTNVKGTWSILEACRQADVPLLFVSTDEVYGQTQGNREFVESDALDPRNPYSASKASAEHLVRAYANTFGVRAVVTRGANTYGSGQNKEKLLPNTAWNFLRGVPGTVYGDGGYSREWLSVSDHAKGILFALQRGTPGETYNIGSGYRRTVNEVLAELGSIGRDAGFWGEFSTVQVKDRPGHDRAYASDSSKLQALGWKPNHVLGLDRYSIESLIQTTREASIKG